MNNNNKPTAIEIKTIKPTMRLINVHSTVQAKPARKGDTLPFFDFRLPGYEEERPMFEPYF